LMATSGNVRYAQEWENLTMAKKQPTMKNKENAAAEALQNVLNAVRNGQFSNIEAIGLLRIAENVVLKDMDNQAEAIYAEATKQQAQKDRPNYIG
jgi:hypothetical protein